MASRKEKLTPRQALFVEEYLKDLNGTQAAIRSGYSAKTAQAISSENLRKPLIVAALAEAQAKRSAKTGITQERVLAELAILAFSDVSHYLVNDAGNVDLTVGAPDGAMRAVSSIKRRVTTDAMGSVTRETELRLWNKPEPLKLAGKHVGLFTEKTEEPAPTTIVVYAGMRPPDGADAESAAQGNALPS